MDYDDKYTELAFTHIKKAYNKMQIENIWICLEEEELVKE